MPFCKALFKFVAPNAGFRFFFFRQLHLALLPPSAPLWFVDMSEQWRAGSLSLKLHNTKQLQCAKVGGLFGANLSCLQKLKIG